MKVKQEPLKPIAEKTFFTTERGKASPLCGLYASVVN